MMMLMLSTICLLPFLSPIKTALTVTMSSLLVSTWAYSSSSEMFVACAIIISFSSGMMILFCYCAMLSTYESKNTNKTLILGVIVSSTIWCVFTNEAEPNYKNMEMTINSGVSLCMAMTIIIMAMICINKSTFNPKKTLKSSY
uniref:NADH dehydrogenase subunit 6 n=2 Tax=Aleuroglyphus ovatus TaxID=212130 RepID=A0A023HKA7_ALEOV|nr:NADH dehydrogenase subunit 6 [Aleuroglyphus ovatus]AGM14591.1 NADH dehydrogenase subunit 6 [Aleuroglyphus ovatus]